MVADALGNPGATNPGERPSKSKSTPSSCCATAQVATALPSVAASCVHGLSVSPPMATSITAPAACTCSRVLVFVEGESAAQEVAASYAPAVGR